MTASVTHIAGYEFKEIEQPDQLHKTLTAYSAQVHVMGNVYICREGINLSLAGSRSDIDFMLNKVTNELGFTKLLVHTTYCDGIPYKKLLLKVRGKLVPSPPIIENANDTKASYLSSEQLKEWLDEGKDFTLLDMRNRFEVDLGSFENAKHLDIRNFRDLEYDKEQEKINQLDKNKPVVTFCTGGIRCEKGAPYLAQFGFKDVYQLHGGILGYLAKYKNKHWQGDCFVFDDRVCLDTDLNPLYTRLCQDCQITLKDSEKVFCDNCIPPNFESEQN